MRKRRRQRKNHVPWFRTRGWGTVYLLQSKTEPALFKVGFTQRKTHTRRNELKGLVDGGLRIVFTVSMPHAYVTEQRTLKGLARRWFGRRDRRGTEWFVLRRTETIDDIAKRILRTAREVQFEARLKLSWSNNSEIRTYAARQMS
ncbi:GIY-YIG nuclease family protein [uncultured Tateyamaria sp.]|uniref:GIY-YIG nuclease family protein n=1 Tax=uncultured Tateyamaria sp. TaxID=455651 RepID=UPI00344A35D6